MHITHRWLSISLLAEYTLCDVACGQRLVYCPSPLSVFHHGKTKVVAIPQPNPADFNNVVLLVASRIAGGRVTLKANTNGICENITRTQNGVLGTELYEGTFKSSRSRHELAIRWYLILQSVEE